MTGTELSIGQELLVAAPTGEAVKQNTPVVQNTRLRRRHHRYLQVQYLLLLLRNIKRKPLFKLPPRQNKNQKNKPFVFPNQ